MPMHRYLSLLLLLGWTSALAQEPEAEALPELKRYTVEVVIFGYAQEVASGSEMFVPDEIRIEEIDIESLPSPGEAPPSIEPAADLVPEILFERDLAILDEEEYTMGDIVGMLERLEVYEPLMHFGWSQTTWPEQEKEPLLLTAFGTPPEGLDGELTLYLSRYLHLVVSLQLDAPRDDTELREEPAFAYGDYRTLRDMPDPLRPGPIRYRIEEDRIFRSGELRYFDHPKFGVLAKVTRLEEEMDEDLEGELLGYPVE